MWRGRRRSAAEPGDGIIAASAGCHLKLLIGLPPDKLEKRNASRHAHYSAYYDDELAATVGELYRDDLANFRYAFDGEPPG